MSESIPTENQSLSYSNLDPWTQLRDPDFLETVESIIKESAPDGMRITSITHLRTAHYVACRVDSEAGTWLVRAGVSSPSDTASVDNSGYLGTSASVPTGQNREYRLANEFAAAGVSVAVPEHYATFANLIKFDTGVDVLWMPFLKDSLEPVTALQWAKTLLPLHSIRPEYELPVFTNRAKTIARLESMTDRKAAKKFGKEYDSTLERLFRVATQWSLVHGDAHCGNVLVASGKPVLFDFDTVCWAPSVWDLTHLLSRVGTERNTGYTAEELVSAFDFTDEEIDAALDLRSIASRVAKAVR